MIPGTGQITQLLDRLSQGDKGAEERVIEALYPELRRLARSCLRGERRGHTLQSADLVNEAYLRMVARKDRNWANRAHFLAAAAKVMRRYLIDYARARSTAKRGGSLQKISLEKTLVFTEDRLDDLLELDLALEEYEKLDPRGARVVELHFFGGLTMEETAEVLRSSARTAKRDWAAAKAWIYDRLKPAG